jgi:hypothetical protein
MARGILTGGELGVGVVTSARTAARVTLARSRVWLRDEDGVRRDGSWSAVTIGLRVHLPRSGARER